MKASFFQIKNKNERLEIPLNILQLLIKQIQRNNENIKLKFLSNCCLENISEIQDKYNCLIIFSVNKEVYIYYDKIYQIQINNNKYSIKIFGEQNKINEIIGNIILSIPKKKKRAKKKQKKENSIQSVVNEINLKEEDEANKKLNFNDVVLEELNNKCFCYLVISKDYMKKFIK